MIHYTYLSSSLIKHHLYYLSRTFQKKQIRAQSPCLPGMINPHAAQSYLSDCPHHAFISHILAFVNFFLQVQIQESLTKLQQQNMIPPKTSFRTLSMIEEDVFLFFQEQEEVKEKQAQLKEEENTFICLQQIRDTSQHLSDPLSSSTPSNNSKSPKKSLNHNFQKHAVVTIKKLMRIRYNYNGNTSQKLAHLMWNIFMSSGIKNKKIMVVLFGKADRNDEGLVKLVKKYGFQEILEYQEKTIREAQEILRERFIESVSDDAVMENISKCRNIKQDQQFYVYFMELSKMIRNGPLMRLRINDRTAKKIEAIIKAEKQED